jgi:O-antigen/teichoic acid export membrane protein
MQGEPRKNLTMQTLSLPPLWRIFRTDILGRRFVQDVSVLMIANLVGGTLNFVQGIMVARWLGPELYGTAALVMSYPGLVYTFFDARSTEASVKYLSEFHARNERNRVLAMCRLGYMVDFAIASLACLVVLLTAPWAARTVIHRPEAVELLTVYAVALLPRALVGTSYATLAALGRFAVIAWIDTLMIILRVALVLGLVLYGWQVIGVVWGNAVVMMATGLLYGVMACILMRRTWGASAFQGGWHALRGRRREIFGFLAYNDLHALLGMVPKQLDLILLGHLRGPTEVGYYKLAKSISSVLGYLVGPLQSVSFPKLARLWGLGNWQALRQEVSKLAFQIGLPLGVIALASAMFMPFVLPLMVGQAYRPASAAAQLLFVGSAVWLAFFWLRPLFLACGWVKEWAGWIALFALCNLVGWLLIVPRLGYIGMSAWWLVSTLGVYTIPAIILFIRMDRHEQKG